MSSQRIDNSGDFDNTGTQLVGNSFNPSRNVNVGGSNTNLAIQERNNVYDQLYGDASVAGHGRLWQGNHYGAQVNHYYSAPQTFPKDKCRILLESLTFERMDARLRNVATASPNTCQWLQRHEHFLAWADPSRVQEHGSFLWIKGKPGSGKSTVMKTIVAWAEKEWSSQLILTYFFNARSPNELEKSSLGLYRSLVHQLLTVDPDHHELFTRTFTSKERNGEMAEEWTQIELQNFLIEVMMNRRKQSINLFIDALDEGQDNDVRQMVGYLEHLVHSVVSAGTCIRVCLASRHYPHITVRKSLSITLELQMEHERDIDHYINSRLRGEHTEQGDMLRGQVRDRSGGVFLWVTLVVSQLNQLWDRGRSVRSMLGMIEETPRYLPDLFDTTFARNQENINECLILLRWVLFARQPLRPIELYLAVQSSCDVAIDDIDIPHDSAIRRYLTDCSRGLLEITTFEPSTVQFIHETVREFLINKSGPGKQHLIEDGSTIISRSFRAEECHMTIAEECLRYFIQLAGKNLLTDIEQSALARYAAKQWWQHVRVSKLACSLQVLELAFELLTVNGNLLFWVKHLDGDDGPLWRTRDHEDDPASSMYYAAAIGTAEIVRMLLDHGADVNERRGRTGRRLALQAASMEGYAQIVQMLLDHGADVNTKGGQYGTALVAASSEGHTQIVQMLLDHDADVNAKTRRYGTALMAASSEGHTQIVQMLLDHDADVSTKDEIDGTALMIASSRGHAQIVQMLLDHGADVNAEGGMYGTALKVASQKGHEQICQLLRTYGAKDSENSGVMTAGRRNESPEQTQNTPRPPQQVVTHKQSRSRHKSWFKRLWS